MFRLYSFLSLVTLMLGVHAQGIDVFGPQPFREILNNDFPGTWTPSAYSEVENMQYFMLLDADTRSKAVTLSADDNSSLIVADTSTVRQTYGSVMRSIFQIVDINSDTEDPFAGKYRMVPLLHTYFAFNYSPDNSEVFSVDIGSYYVDEATESGYLVMEMTGSPSSIKIKASAQYTYNPSTGFQEANPSWTTQWLMIDGSKLTLTTAEGSATNFFMADSRDLIDNSVTDGSDFDPTSIEWQTNPFAAFPEEVWKYEDSDFYDQFLGEVDESYQSQFGDHASTLIAATAALEEIDSTLSANGESMRYDQEVYLAFRENLLSRTLEATDIYNGRLGERLVAYVYFTNAADDSGVYHPFMVIASHNISDSPNFLIDVSRPPGDGEGGGYAEQSITRNAVLGFFLIKIPLKDYGLITNLTDNDLTPYGVLAADAGVDPSDYDVYNYAGPNSQAVAIDGVVVYPAYNNNIRFAPEDGEITSTGIHVGRGMGLHYHADGNGFNHNGINLYNPADYPGRNHPPMIGFGYDGIVMFGRYEADFDSMLGYNDPLDEYGGHNHDGFGYHYHAFSQEFEALGPVGSDPIPFTQHFFNVGAWKGKINDIPGFLEVTPQQLKDEDIARFGGASSGTGGSPGPGPNGEVTACGSYTWEGTTYTMSGTYTANLTNSMGGDSLATLNLTIIQASSSEETVTTCGSYEWNGETFTQSGNYEKSFPGSAGCDSTAILHLTISDALSAEVTVAGSTLSVMEQAGVTYQWIDCAGGDPIPGETASELITTKDGVFAVIVTSGECSVTSDCKQVNGSILGVDQQSNVISLYPNPTRDAVKLIGLEGTAIVTILSVTGKVLHKNHEIGAGENILMPGASGIYIVKIETADSVVLKRVVKR